MEVLLVLLDVAVTSSLLAQITVLQVSVDVEVIVHAVGITLLSCGRQILLQLLQLVYREEVSLGEDDLRINKKEEYIQMLHQQLGFYILQF